MQEQGGREPARYNVPPVDHLVERVELAGVVEAAEDKRNQAEDIEMTSFISAAPAEVNEHSDGEITESDKILVGKRDAMVDLGDVNRCVRHHPRAPECINRLSPCPAGSQCFRNVLGSADRNALDGFQNVVDMNAGAVARATGGYPGGHHSPPLIPPGHSVFRQPENLILLVIQHSGDRGRYSQHREDGGR
jgi:hypothetical protein